MGSASILRKVLWLPVFALAFASLAGAAGAQTATFTGRVTSMAGQPLNGASVSIPDLGAGGVADADGRYTFTVEVARTAGRNVDVVARYIGYKPKRLPLTLAAGRVEHNFSLERDVLNLEEVVVTGTSEAMSQKKLAFSVGVVDNTQIKDTPGTSPIAALDGKIPGASVVSQSGQPGGEPAIRLRSHTSLTGRQDPLVIVDGTIINLGLADLNSEDIERIEVIKGAAASSLYGSNAANGVIQIFTKRGANLGEGQTVFTTRTEYGQNDLPKNIEGNMSHNYRLNADGSYNLSATGARQDEPDKITDNRYPVYYDQLGLVFQGGSFLTNYVSVGQRRGTSNFNASFQNTKETGILTVLEGFSRQNFRLNVDQELTDNIDLGMGAFYGKSHSDQGEFAFPWFGLRFLEPDTKIDELLPDGTYNPVINRPPLSGNVSNPLYVLQQHKQSNDRDRFTGTFRAAYRPLTWLTAEGNIGYDEGNQGSRSFTPIGYTSSSGSVDNGAMSQTAARERSYNIGTYLTAVRSFWDVRNTTKAALVYEDQHNASVGVTAPALAVPKVTEFAAAAQDPNNPVSPNSRTELIRNTNTFLISTFDIKDRYIIDGLVRQDRSSLFGADERSAIYHRLSAAYRVSEDFTLPGVDEFKLRLSHGTAGLRPQFDAQYEVQAVVAGNLTKVTLGNRELKPAYSRETEYGFNVNFLTNYNFEYSYSKRRTADQIMLVPLSAGTGYQNQWRNAGTLDGKSHEFALGAVLMSKADRFWRVNLTADRARATVADLKVPAFFIGLDENTKMFFIAKGEPLGIIYGDKWIRTEAELAETIRSGGNPSVPSTSTVSDYQLNEEGFYVPKSTYQTIAELPLKAVKCLNEACTSSAVTQRIGDVNPDFNFGLSSNAQWKSFSLNGVVTWVKGGDIYNLTRQWPFNELRDKAYDQSAKPAVTCAADWPTTAPKCPYSTGKKPSTYYSAFYNGINPNDYFVEDGSYMRLRELALTWSLPQKWVSRIPVADFRNARLGIVGRNLWTSTDYTGYNPDVSAVVNRAGNYNPFVHRVDYFTYPAYRTFSAMVELGF